MRLPEIQYGGEVQSKGRYQSKAGELTIQTAKMESEGLRQAGRMVSEATQNAGQMIANAERQAARSTSQKMLANEKYKNDKIAQYEIQGAKLDIESQLAGDILQIRTDVEKYTLDRNYQLGLEVLGVEADLARTKLGIEAELARNKLDIQSELKLDILDIQSDQQMFQTLLGGATQVANLVIDTYVQRQNTKQELRSAENISSYQQTMLPMVNELANNRTVDISSAAFADTGIAEEIKKDGNIVITEAVKPDGTVGQFVESHEVSAMIYTKMSDTARSQAMNGVTSEAHILALTQKLDNLDIQYLSKLTAASTKQEQEWNEGWAENIINDDIDIAKSTGGDNTKLIKDINNFKALGILTPFEAETKLKEANNEIWTGHFKDQMEGAKSKEALNRIKDNYTSKGLTDTSRKSLDVASRRREDEIEKEIANETTAVYQGIAGPLHEIGPQPGQTGGEKVTVLADYVYTTMVKRGVDETDAIKYKDKFISDNRQYQAVKQEEINRIAGEAKAYNDRGQIAPESVLNQLPNQYKAVAEKANKQISDGGHVATNGDFYAEQRIKATNPATKEQWAKDYKPAMHTDKLKQADWDRLLNMQERIKAGKDPESSAMLKINDTRFSSLAIQRFGPIAGRTADQQKSVNSLHYIANERLEQATAANGRPLNENETQAVINTTFNEGIEMAVPTLGGGKYGKGYNRKAFDYIGDKGLRNTPFYESVPALVDMLKARGVVVEPAEIAALFGEAGKAAIAEGEGFTLESVKKQLGIQDGALAAKVEILHNLRISEMNFDAENINVAYDKGRQAAEIAGIPPTGANIMKMVDNANNLNISLDELLKAMRNTAR